MDTLKEAKPEVTIELGGKKRRLAFNWWAISLIQEDFGQDFLSKLNFKSPTKHQMTAVIWAALVTESPELDGDTASERRAGRKRVALWLDSCPDTGTLWVAVVEAVVRSYGSQGDSSKNESAAAEPGTPQPAE